MKVFVCTFTEHDLDFTGRVFYTLEDALKVLEATLDKSFMQEYELEDAQAYLDAGYITFKETAIEGGGEPLNLEMVTIPQNSYGEGGGVSLRYKEGGELFGVREGEPEDMTIGRDLSDCANVEYLVTLGYEAAQQGRELDIEYLDDEEEEG